MATAFRIRSNRVLHPDGAIRPATIVTKDGCIQEIGDSSTDAIDAGDLLMVPGIVDLHGDAFERQIHPRARSAMPVEIGLLETDRQLAANGITTAFHGLTVTWAPGSRDIHSARAILEALDRVAPRLVCDTKIHLRHEALSLDTIEEVCGWIRGGRVCLVALNDHAHIMKRAVERGTVADFVSMPPEDYAILAQRYFAREAEVGPGIRRIAAATRKAELPFASHDDNTPIERAEFRALGCTLCEFPADVATAEAARLGGDHVILGAPNILRGGSHCGRVGAADMIREGLCTILCSDYYYPSILLAPFQLAAEGLVPFATAWDLVSNTPARAAGLHDRGTIEPGKRADVLLIDDSDPAHPEVRACFAAGRQVYTRGEAVSQPMVHIECEEALL